MLTITESSVLVKSLDVNKTISQITEGDQELEIDTSGIFRARVSSAGLQSSKKGFPMVVFGFTTVDGRQFWDRHELGKSGRRTLALAVRILLGRFQEMGIKIRPEDDMNKVMEELASRDVEYDVCWESNNYGGNVKWVAKV